MALYLRCEAMHRSKASVGLLEEAVALHRRLMRRDPAAAPRLAVLLGWLGGAWSDAGEHERAREPVAEAVGLFRRLAREQPAVYESQLAIALCLQGIALDDAGDREGSVRACREALGELRHLELAELDPYLAAALRTLSAALLALGRGRETFPYVTEAVEVARRVRERDPSAENARLLGSSLNRQAAALVSAERWEEALPPAEESARWYAEAQLGLGY